MALAEPTDFKRFHLEAVGVDRAEAARTLFRNGLGDLPVGSDDAFVDPDAIRELVADPTSAGWEQDFARMIDNARARGWISADGRIQLHVDWR